MMEAFMRICVCLILMGATLIVWIAVAMVAFEAIRRK